MKDKTKNSYDNKRGNSLKTDFSKNLNQLIEDQSSNLCFKKKKFLILSKAYQRK
jgi:hypothetical protein